MKKVITFIILAVLVLSLAVTASAEDIKLNFIADTIGIIQEDDWYALNNRSEDIYNKYGVGIYAVIVDDFNDYTHYTKDDVLQCAEDIYSDYNLGGDADRNGILLLLSMRERDYALYVNGRNAKYAFNDNGVDYISEQFLDDFGRNDWVSGLEDYFDTCDELLKMASQNDPYNIKSSNSRSNDSNSFVKILCVIFIPLVIAGIVCLVQNGKMKSVTAATSAAEYIVPGGMSLRESWDHFTHITVTRVRIDNDSHTRSGHSGSGRSGKF